jgi:6-phosphogluconolactonase (cycloisomerase 2 family)
MSDDHTCQPRRRGGSETWLETSVDRRQVLAAGALGAAGVILALSGIGLPGTAFAETPARFAYVGSYTKDPPGGGNDNPVGLSVFRVDPRSGEFMLIQQVPSANPSFVALDPNQRFLYVINEIDDYQGQKTGSAEAYSINPETGILSLLNRQPVMGTIPGHLTVDPTGKYLIVANYMGGNFVTLPIEPDGRLGTVVGSFANKGSGPNEERQEGPHPHVVVFDKGKRFIATADLGIDKVQILRLDGGNLQLVSEASMTPGAGPRHVVFHDNGGILYVVNELNATITALEYDQSSGQLGRQLQTVSTEPAGYAGPQSTAEIAIHPSGKFLYASNRGHNSIAGFRIDPANGMLSPIGHTTSGIDFPRNFAIDPSGAWLYAANQKGDTIVQFRVDQGTGKLAPTGHVTRSVTPVAIVFSTRI